MRKTINVMPSSTGSNARKRRKIYVDKTVGREEAKRGRR
jgi:hypothetical protein